MAFTVKLADKIISVQNIYSEVESFCKDYLVETATPDLTICLTREDILFEEEQSSEQNCSPSYLESLALLRKISDIFPSYGRFLMHGASISYKGYAYLFTAPSGTGKSTHIRLWKKYLGNEVEIVNGDKPFISLATDTEIQREPLIYGTPWAGKERWQRNCSAPLHGICFLQQGTNNSIRRMESAECLTMLLRQVYIPKEVLAAGLTLELIDSLLKQVPVYLLTCDMSEEAVRCSFETMTGLTYPSNM